MLDFFFELLKLTDLKSNFSSEDATKNEDMTFIQNGSYIPFINFIHHPGFTDLLITNLISIIILDQFKPKLVLFTK